MVQESFETVELTTDRKLASIRRVGKISEIFVAGTSPLEPAQNIEQIMVGGWRLVAKKGEFEEGDFCVYFEPDSILPEAEWSEFLRPKKFHIRVMKLNKFVVSYKDTFIPVISSGLALPLSILLDANVTDLIGVKKKEDEVTFSTGNRKGSFPEFIPKTDEKRVQSYMGALADIGEKPYIITEKYDGTSCTFYYDQTKNEFIVCSRNHMVKGDESNVYWDNVKQYEDIMRNYPTLALQGEIVGPSIQKNPRKLNKQQFFCYNVYDFESGRHFSSSEWVTFCESHNIPMVNIVETGDSFQYYLTDLEEMAKNLHKNDNTGIKPEGIVIRSLTGEYSPALSGRLSFKVINEEYEIS